MKLPLPPRNYLPDYERQRNMLIEDETDRALKRGRDNTLTPGTRFNPPVWEDLRFPATLATRGPGSTNPEFDTETPGLLFRGNNTDTVYFIAQLPHAWAEETALRPHVHWQKTTSAAGNVMWRLEFKWAAIGVQSEASWTELKNAEASVSDNDTLNVHALTSLGEISGEGRKISDMLLMKLSRVHNDPEDTYGTTARLLEFDIHYQIDGFGSRQVFIK